jgi:hypothetical protein
MFVTPCLWAVLCMQQVQCCDTQVQQFMLNIGEEEAGLIFNFDQ